MDERSKRLAAAKQKLQVYKLQHQKPQTPPGDNHTNAPAVVIPQTHRQDSPVDLQQSQNTSIDQTPNLSQRSSPGLSSNNTGHFTPSSWTDSQVIDNAVVTTTTLFTNPNPESYFTVTPLVPVNGAFSESSQQYEPGNSKQYEYSYPTPAPYQQQSEDSGVLDTTNSAPDSKNSAPFSFENNGHPQEGWHVHNNTHEAAHTHDFVHAQAHVREETKEHGHSHENPHGHGHDHEHRHGHEHTHDEEVELRSMQNHHHHHPHEHNYFNELQQQSSLGQDAFELELSQLRQDNAHLSRRETELTGQLQETERTLQDLRRERDNLAQEVRSELGPLKDKVNVLFEENQIFRLKLDEMTSRVDVAEAEKLRNETKFEEMQSAFMIVSNAKMVLAEKLDVETEHVKVLNATIQEKDNQIQTLTLQNQELMKSAADLEKALDSYAEEQVDLDEENTRTQLIDAHAKIILLEKELNELRTIVHSQAVSSRSGQHQQEENCKRDHDHDHGPGQHHAQNHDHEHGHGHDNHQHEGHDHPHPPEHGRDHGQSHDHDKDHEHHHQTIDGDTHSHASECDHDHDQNHSSHNHSHGQGQGHGHSHDHGQGQEHSHDQDHGHGHSHGNGNGGHSQDSDLGKGGRGHEPTPMEKKQARLEWENQTYREELEKLATLLKVKTADATALSIYREENEKMKNELARLEHMVIQLQGENDTIGDYITLYQSQKLALKEKALQKEAEMVTLGKEREQLRVRMEELNQILRSYNKNENQPELPVHKINELITEINTNFHPCGVCSGRLLNV